MSPPLDRILTGFMKLRRVKCSGKREREKKKSNLPMAGEVPKPAIIWQKIVSALTFHSEGKKGQILQERLNCQSEAALFF